MQKTSPPTEELNRQETSGPLTTPPVIDSTIAASEVTSTEVPEEPDISKHPTVPLAPLSAPKQYFQVNWWSLVALALLLILIGEHAAPLLLSLVDEYLHPKATVTIFPTQKQISQTYSYLVVTGTADPSHSQISSRVLSFTTPTKTGTIATTGIGYTPATKARGTVMFYNSAIYSQTIAAGTVIISSAGVHIVTDERITINAGNPPYSYGIAQAPAHSIEAGTVGNIPPLDINGLCCIAGISVKNTNPFTGGVNPKPYPMLSNADLKREAAHLAGELSPLAHEGIQSQMRGVEQFLVPMQCSMQTTSSPKVGERATTATVSVSETCLAQVYDNAALEGLISMKFMEDAAQQLGSSFVERGNLTIAKRNAALLDASHSTYRMVIRAEGTLVFHLTASQAQTLKKSIAGKSVSEAQQELLELSGVAGVYIKPAHQSDISLPTDPGSIVLVVSERINP